MSYFDNSDYLPNLKNLGLTENSRPRPNITFIDDVGPTRSTDVYESWRESTKDKHKTSSSRKHMAYHGVKKRPMSSGSSSSSVSSIPYNKGPEVL